VQEAVLPLSRRQPAWAQARNRGQHLRRYRRPHPLVPVELAAVLAAAQMPPPV